MGYGGPPCIILQFKIFKCTLVDCYDFLSADGLFIIQLLYLSYFSSADQEVAQRWKGSETAATKGDRECLSN